MRATVPLFGTRFDQLEEHGRFAVTDQIFLVALDESEQQRIKTYAKQWCEVRMEFFGVLPDFPRPDLVDIPTTNHAWEYVEQARAGVRRVLTQISLLSLAARLHPNHKSILADVWSGHEWRRIHAVGESEIGWNSVNYSHFPLSRAATWGALCSNWPESMTRQLSLALGYYLDGVLERQTRGSTKAFMSAAIAVEVLLGHQSKTEITRTISQRGGHLVAQGEAARTVAEMLHKIYGVRSKLVHTGSDADERDLIILQQYLMAALPAVAAIHPIESHTLLINDLDACNFGMGTMSAALRAGGWWSFVPISQLASEYLHGN